jgi:ribosomal protein L7/L12/uncharacterized RDD family membrane protein YckC
MTNKPAALGKRIVAALIDMIMIVTIVQFLLILISQSPLGDPTRDFIVLQNSYLAEFGLGEYVTSNGVTSFVQHSSLADSLIESFNSFAVNNNEYMSAYNKYLDSYFWNSVLAIFVVEFILLGIIPFFNKHYQTCGKVIMRLGVIDEKYDMNLGTKNRVFRFLGSFVIETFAILLFFKGTMIDMVTIMSPLIVLTIIMFSSQKQALHDVLAKSKVVDLRTAVIFESVGEKEAYDAEYMETHQDELNFDTDKKVKKEEPIEAEVEEVIDDEDDPFMKEEDKPLELSKTSVFINDYPKGRVKDVVFAIQDVTDLNVVDAKRLLDNLPCLVKTNLEVEEANKIKEVLENVGVTVEVR